MESISSDDEDYLDFFVDDGNTDNLKHKKTPSETTPTTSTSTLTADQEDSPIENLGNIYPVRIESDSDDNEEDEDSEMIDMSPDIPIGSETGTPVNDDKTPSESPNGKGNGDAATSSKNAWWTPKLKPFIPKINDQSLYKQDISKVDFELRHKTMEKIHSMRRKPDEPIYFNFIRRARLLSAYAANPQKRQFGGNHNYLVLFQSEERRFLEYESDNSEESLIGSYISISGSRKGKVNQDGCSFWSSSEKDRFFTLLGRYSIHRVQEIKKHLPKKSVAEILAYYHVLKKETQRHKRRRKDFSKLVSIDQMPACYEMSSEFISMEESEARRLLSVDKRRISNIVEIRTNRGRRDLNAADPFADLIDKDKLEELSGKVYIQQNFLERNIQLYESKHPPIYDDDSLWTLRAHIKNFTYDLMLNIIENKLTEGGREFEERFLYKDRALFALRVNKKDVAKAYKSLQTNRPQRLKHYWRGIIPRLKLIVLKDNEELTQERVDRKMFDNRSSASVTDPRKQAKRIDNTHRQDLSKFSDYAVNPQDFDRYLTLLGDQTDKNKIPLEVDEYGEEADQILDVSPGYFSAIRNATSYMKTVHNNGPAPSQLAASNSIQAYLESKTVKKQDLDMSDHEDWIIDGDKYIRENELMVEKLFLLETSLLARKDYEASLKYENTLLHMLMAKPEEIRFNDEALSKLYYYHQYDPAALGFKRKAAYRNIEWSARGLSTRRTRNNITRKQLLGEESDENDDDDTNPVVTCYTEDDPLNIPNFDDVSDDMMFMHSFHFSEYDS